MATPAVSDTRERFTGSFQKTVTKNRVRHERTVGAFCRIFFSLITMMFFFLIFRVPVIFFLHTIFSADARPTVSRPSSWISNANGIRCADVLVCKHVRRTTHRTHTGGEEGGRLLIVGGEDLARAGTQNYDSTRTMSGVYARETTAHRAYFSTGFRHYFRRFRVVHEIRCLIPPGRWWEREREKLFKTDARENLFGSSDSACPIANGVGHDWRRKGVLFTR